MVNKAIRHRAIVDTFSEDLFASFDGADQCFHKPCMVWSYPIWGIKTRSNCIFDDTFWDVFHTYPFHICHVAWSTKEEVYEIRFKVDENRTFLGKEVVQMEKNQFPAGGG